MPSIAESIDEAAEFTEPHQIALGQAVRLIDEPTALEDFLRYDVLVFSDQTDLLLRQTLEDLRGPAALIGVSSEQKHDADRKLCLLLELLRRCREAGLEQAFAEFESSKPPPEGIELYPSCVAPMLDELAAVRNRYALGGDPGDLRSALRRFETLLASNELLSARPLFRLMMIDDASNTFRDASDVWKEPQQLDSAIRLLRESAAQTPHDSPDYPVRQLRVALLLRERYDLAGSKDDFEQGCAVLQRLLRVPNLHFLFLQASAEPLSFWLRRAYRDGLGVSCLDQEVGLYESLLGRSDLPDAESTRLKINLADALRVRFQESGRHADLERAATLLDATISTMPASPARAIALVNFGFVLVEQGASAGTTEELERAFKLFIDARDDDQCPEAERRRIVEGLAAAVRHLEQLGGATKEQLAGVETRVQASRLRELTDLIDPARQDHAEGKPESGQGAGERLLAQNRWMRRELFILAAARTALRTLLTRLVLAATTLLVLSGSALAFDKSRPVLVLVVLLLSAALAVIYKGGRLVLRQRKFVRDCQMGIDLVRKPIASWSDEPARKIIESAASQGTPFALYLRGFEAGASDRSFDLDEDIGPLYTSSLGNPFSPIERKLKKLAPESLTLVTLANPADLLAPVCEGGVARLLVPERQWRLHLHKLIDASSLVVMECPEFSPGVTHELSYLGLNGHQDKTLIVIPEENISATHLLQSILAPALAMPRHPQASKGSPWFEGFPHVVEERELSREAIEIAWRGVVS